MPEVLAHSLIDAALLQVLAELLLQALIQLLGTGSDGSALTAWSAPSHTACTAQQPGHMGPSVTKPWAHGALCGCKLGRRALYAGSLGSRTSMTAAWAHGAFSGRRLKGVWVPLYPSVHSTAAWVHEPLYILPTQHIAVLVHAGRVPPCRAHHTACAPAAPHHMRTCTSRPPHADSMALAVSWLSRLLLGSF